jgi:hypothetical protein
MDNHESIPTGKRLGLEPVNIRAQAIVYFASLKITTSSINEKIEDIRRDGILSYGCIGEFIYRHTQGTQFGPPTFPYPDAERE